MARILLISANRIQEPYVYPIGLGYIHSGLVLRGYEAEILDLAHIDFNKKTIWKYLNEYKPDYIGISIRNLDNCCYLHSISFAPDVHKLVKWIYELNHNQKIILGGSGFSLAPESWLDFLNVSYGIINDGTLSFAELISQLESDNESPNVSGLIYRGKDKYIQYPSDTGEAFLNIFPSREVYIHDLLPDIPVNHNVLTKKGCIYKCTFCAYPCLEGNQIIMRKPKHVIDEIIKMIEENHITEFDFVDSVFNYPRSHAEEICNLIINHNLKVSFKCFLNPYKCSKHFIRILKQAGCRHAELGIDTAAIDMIKSMKKGFQREDICECIENCKEIGLSYSVCLLFGAPNETLNTVDETLALMEELDVNELFGLIGIRLLPKTEVYSEYLKNEKECDLLFPKFYCSNSVKSDEIKELFYKKYKSKHPNWIIV